MLLECYYTKMNKLYSLDGKLSASTTGAAGCCPGETILFAIDEEDISRWYDLMGYALDARTLLLLSKVLTCVYRLDRTRGSHKYLARTSSQENHARWAPASGQGGVVDR